MRRLNTNLDVKGRGVISIAIPRLLAVSSWTRPLANKMLELRTRIIEATVGKNRGMRCPEVVVGVIGNPVHQDPWGALIYNTIYKAVRLVRKSPTRMDLFLSNAADALGSDKNWSQRRIGPVKSFLMALDDLDARVFINAGNKTVEITTPDGPTVDLLNAPAGVIKAELTRMVRRKVLNKLVKNVDGSKGGKPRRKDMVGISSSIDLPASLGMQRLKKTPVDGLKLKHAKQISLAITTGSVRAGDRLKAAKLIESDACDCCGQRHTTHHVLWNCLRFREIRQPYVRKQQAILAVAKKFSEATCRRVQEVYDCNAFQHTGIVNADQAAVPWRAKRPTNVGIPTQYPSNRRIRWVKGATAVARNGKVFLGVFTDGSIKLPTSQYLAHGGWGTYVAPIAEANNAGHLCGLPLTSFRAEVAAMADALTRADVAICVISDCQAAVRILGDILRTGGSKDEDIFQGDCDDLWRLIIDVAKQHPAGYHHTE